MKTDLMSPLLVVGSGRVSRDSSARSTLTPSCVRSVKRSSSACADAGSRSGAATSVTAAAETAQERMRRLSTGVPVRERVRESDILDKGYERGSVLRSEYRN